MVSCAHVKFLVPCPVLTPCSFLLLGNVTSLWCHNGIQLIFITKVGSSEKNLREIFDSPPEIHREYKKNYGEHLAKQALHVIVLDGKFQLLGILDVVLLYLVLNSSSHRPTPFNFRI